MDYQALLFNPIYDTLGVLASIEIEGSDGGIWEDLKVIDKTSGEEVGNQVETLTIVPAAYIRMAELEENELTRDMLENALITFSDTTWRIKSQRPRPSPKGQADGELLLILEEYDG